MTARTTHNNTTQIHSQGSNPKEVLAIYEAELKQHGHDIVAARHVMGTDLAGRMKMCRGCGVQFRIYNPIIGNEVSIYSDFEDGMQCPKKHMNVFGGES
jgi:hypothetical protein